MSRSQFHHKLPYFKKYLMLEHPQFAHRNVVCIDLKTQAEIILSFKL